MGNTNDQQSKRPVITKEQLKIETLQVKFRIESEKKQQIGNLISYQQTLKQLQARQFKSIPEEDAQLVNIYQVSQRLRAFDILINDMDTLLFHIAEIFNSQGDVVKIQDIVIKIKEIMYACNKIGVREFDKYTEKLAQYFNLSIVNEQANPGQIDPDLINWLSLSSPTISQKREIYEDFCKAYNFDFNCVSQGHNFPQKSIHLPMTEPLQKKISIGPIQPIIFQQAFSNQKPTDIIQKVTIQQGPILTQPMFLGTVQGQQPILQNQPKTLDFPQEPIIFQKQPSLQKVSSKNNAILQNDLNFPHEPLLLEKRSSTVKIQPTLQVIPQTQIPIQVLPSNQPAIQILPQQQPNTYMSPYPIINSHPYQQLVQNQGQILFNNLTQQQVGVQNIQMNLPGQNK